MLVLTETSNRSRTTSLSLVVNLKDKRMLLLAQRSNIEVYLCEEESLSLIATWKLEHCVRSWAKFSWNSRNYVVLIDSEYNVKLIELSNFNPYRAHLKIAITSIVKLSTQGQRVSPNLDAPILFPVGELDPEYIILHLFYSNIQIFSVKDALDPSSTVVPYTRSTGQIDIKQIVNLIENSDTRINDGAKKGSNSCTLAMLYKDITSAYYLRYLDFSGTRLTLNVSRQLALFEEEPSLIQPCIQQPGGLIVYTSSSMFYFPPERFRHISTSRETKNIFISTKTHDAHVIVTMNKPGRGKHKTIYKCFELIDAQRTLLTSNTGETFLLYMDLQVSTYNSLIVNQINMINLDYTTIPISYGLHHVQGNQFFQASKTSKSILFEILPTRPNINILDSIEGNPPVIDLKEAKNGELFACQGGWDGGQLRRYTFPRCNYNVTNTAKISDGPLKIIGESSDQYIFGDSTEGNQNTILRALIASLTPVSNGDQIEKDIILVSKIEEHTIVLSLSGLKIDDDKKVEEQIAFGQIQAREGVAWMVTTDYQLHVYDFLQNASGIHYIINQCHSKGDEISSVDVYHDEDTYWILISLLSGKYKILNMCSQQQKLVYEGSSDHAVYSSCIFVEKSLKTIEAVSVYIFLLFTTGEVEQVKFELSNEMLTPTKAVSEKVSDIPYSWKRSNKRIVGFNSEGLVVPKKLKPLDQFGFTKIERSNVVDINLDNTEANRSIVAFDDGTIEKWEIEFRELTQLKDFQSLYSDRLFVKCLPIATKYVVVVAYDTTISPGEIRTELMLINSKTLEIYDVFKFHDSTEVVDLCETPEFIRVDAVAGFICLPSNAKHPVAIFKIWNDQIKLFEKFHISGLSILDDLKFASITYVPSFHLGNYMITGSLNFLCSLYNANGFHLRAIPGSLVPAPSFGLTLTIAGPRYLIADVTAGISSYSMVELDLEKGVSIPNTAERCLTTMSHTLSKTNNDYHVAGYSSGNVVVFNSYRDEFEKEMIKFLIDGDQVNSITGSNGEEAATLRIARIGTLNGGIFTLNKIVDQNWEEAIKKCKEELNIYAREKSISTFKIKELECFDLGSSGPIGIIDGRVLLDFFGNNDSENDDKFPSLVANKSILQKIYCQCCL